MIHPDDIEPGDTLILWHGDPRECVEKPYFETSRFIPCWMVVIRFEGQVGMMEMSVNVDSVVRAVQMELWG